MNVILLTEVCSPGFGRYAGTYRIATELRDNGFSVQVIEYFTRWTTEELKSAIKRFITEETLMVGISTTFLQNEILRDRTETVPLKEIKLHEEGIRLSQYLGRTDWPEIYDTIKSCNPDTKVVVGGHKAGKMYPGKYIDYPIMGEGEKATLNLLTELDSMRGNLLLPEKKRLQEPYREFTTSTIRYEENDLIFPGEHLPIEIARGCIFKCAFCSYALNGKKLWEFNREPHLVRKDLQHAYDNYGSTGFMFCDDTYNDSVEKVKAFNEEFKKLSFNQTFSTYARADLIVSHPETIDMLYESGLRSVFFGIETLNHQSGKRIGKGMEPEKLKEGLYKIKESWPDVIISCGMIVGLPHDTEETLRKNNEWFLRDDCPVDYPSYYSLYIAPNTPGGGLYGEASDHNSSIGDSPWSFGYDVDKNGWWQSQWMNRTEADQLTQEFKNSIGDLPGRERHAESVPWVFFNRMQNIGYTPTDLAHGSLNQNDIMEKENVLYNEYKRRLGEL